MRNSNKARREKVRWEPGEEFKRRVPVLLETGGIESVKAVFRKYETSDPGVRP